MNLSMCQLRSCNRHCNNGGNYQMHCDRMQESPLFQGRIAQVFSIEIKNRGIWGLQCKILGKDNTALSQDPSVMLTITPINSSTKHPSLSPSNVPSGVQCNPSMEHTTTPSMIASNCLSLNPLNPPKGSTSVATQIPLRNLPIVPTTAHPITQAMDPQ
jgi:hypothetical protein